MMEPVVVKFNVYYRDPELTAKTAAYRMETIEIDISHDTIPWDLSVNEYIFCEAVGRAFAHAHKCGFEVMIVEEIEMLKSEFEELTGQTVPDEEYRVIEQVYMYHPLFEVDEPKQQAAELYKRFGFLIFLDMHATAMIQAKYENDRGAAWNDFNERIKQLDEWYNYEMYNRGIIKK